MCVCVGVLYSNPNRWMDPDEIWHEGGPRGGKVLGGEFDPIPYQTKPYVKILI